MGKRGKTEKESEPVEADAPEASGDGEKLVAHAKDAREVSVTAFIVRRALAGLYLSAFLSLLAQAEGLFNCAGMYPTPASSLIYFLAFAGSVLAAMAVLGFRVVESLASVTYALLWGLFAACVFLAPAGYDLFEDKLVLEIGLVCMLLVPTRPSKGTVGMGQSLAAWLLFRALFTPSVGKVTMEGGSWRDFSAWFHTGQLEPFPMPTAWLLYHAPMGVTSALAAIHLWMHMALPLLMLVPVPGIRQTAAGAQIFFAFLVAARANNGCVVPGVLTLLLAQMDDEWHRGLFGRFLFSWGVPLRPGEKKSAAKKGKKKSAAAASSAAPAHPLTVETLLLVFVSTAAVAGLGAAAGMGGDVPELLAIRAMVAGRSAAEWFLAAQAVAAAGLLVSGLAVVFSGASIPLKLTGLLVWAAGSAQLVAEMAPAPLNAQVAPVADFLERAHLSHSFWPSEQERAPRPHKHGVPIVSFEALLGSTDEIDTRGRARSFWTYVGPRFQPSGEARPALLQPYTPRLDLAVWDLGWRVERELLSKPPGQAGKIPTPSWLPTVMDAMYRRSGDSARLVVGPWDSPVPTLYKQVEDVDKYAKQAHQQPFLATPRLRMLCARRLFTPDIHDNRWWAHVSKISTEHITLLLDMEAHSANEKGFQLMHNPEMAMDPEEVINGIRALSPRCTLPPWDGLPAAEVLLTLVLASLAVIVFMPP